MNVNPVNFSQTPHNQVAMHKGRMRNNHLTYTQIAIAALATFAGVQPASSRNVDQHDVYGGHRSFRTYGRWSLPQPHQRGDMPLSEATAPPLFGLSPQNHGAEKQNRVSFKHPNQFITIPTTATTTKATTQQAQTTAGSIPTTPATTVKPKRRKNKHYSHIQRAQNRNQSTPGKLVGKKNEQEKTPNIAPVAITAVVSFFATLLIAGGAKLFYSRKQSMGTYGVEMASIPPANGNRATGIDPLPGDNDSLILGLETST